MIIKEISTNKKIFIIRNLKEDYNNPIFKFKLFYKNYKDFEYSELEHLKINKKYNLLDFEILEG